MEPGLKLGIVYIGKAGGKVRKFHKMLKNAIRKSRLNHLASKLVKFHTISISVFQYSTSLIELEVSECQGLRLLYYCVVDFSTQI